MGFAGIDSGYGVVGEGRASYGRSSMIGLNPDLNSVRFPNPTFEVTEGLVTKLSEIPSWKRPVAVLEDDVNQRYSLEAHAFAPCLRQPKDLKPAWFLSFSPAGIRGDWLASVNIMFGLHRSSSIFLARLPSQCQTPIRGRISNLYACTRRPSWITVKIARIEPVNEKGVSAITVHKKATSKTTTTTKADPYGDDNKKNMQQQLQLQVLRLRLRRRSG